MFQKARKIPKLRVAVSFTVEVRDGKVIGTWGIDGDAGGMSDSVTADLNAARRNPKLVRLALEAAVARAAGIAIQKATSSAIAQYDGE